MSKLNFVFFIRDIKDKVNFYNDIAGLDNLQFIYKNHAFNSKLNSIVFKLVFSQKINRRMKIYGKNFWFKKIVNSIKFVKDNSLVFIFHAGWYDYKFVTWMKKNYPDVKKVIYFDDTIECYSKDIPSMNPYKLSEEYDVVLCYNPSDVEKYGFYRSNAYFSKLPSNRIISSFKSDISFVGQAKDRIQILEDVFNYIYTECKCNFIIVGNTNKNNGISYTKKYLDYSEYLGIEINSNCILEIIKGDTKGATYRCWEAVYYNKKLLTNWNGIYSFEYYNPKYMMYFQDPKDIDINFIKDRVVVDYAYKNDNSPIRLLEYIEEIFNSKYVEYK